MCLPQPWENYRCTVTSMIWCPSEWKLCCSAVDKRNIAHRYTVNKNKYAHARAMSCFVVDGYQCISKAYARLHYLRCVTKGACTGLPFDVRWCGLLRVEYTHIVQGYLTGVTIWLSQCHCSKPEDMDWYITWIYEYWWCYAGYNATIFASLWKSCQKLHLSSLPIRPVHLIDTHSPVS